MPGKEEGTLPRKRGDCCRKTSKKEAPAKRAKGESEVAQVQFNPTTLVSSRSQPEARTSKKEASSLEEAGPILLNKTEIWVDGILPFVGRGSGICSVVQAFGNLDILGLACQKGLPVDCLGKDCEFYASPSSETIQCSTCSKGITPKAYKEMLEEKEKFRGELWAENIRQDRPYLSEESFNSFCTHLQQSKRWCPAAPHFMRRLEQELNALEYREHPFSFSPEQVSKIEEIWDTGSPEYGPYGWRHHLDHLTTWLMNDPWNSQSNGVCYYGNQGIVPRSLQEAKAMVQRNERVLIAFLDGRHSFD